jgi:hypothetical protein
MGVYVQRAVADGSRSLLVAENLRLPLEPELLQMLNTFPLNVILAVTALLVVGIIIAFNRKPTRSKNANVDVDSQPMRNVDEEMPNSVKDANMLDGTAKEFEEEMPRRFEGNKDGVVKLYNWFYRFAQSRLTGVTDDMTPREFQSVVLGLIPSDGVSALEYLVTSFEIANYSAFKITEEIIDKSFKAIEVLRSLIENMSPYVHENDLLNVESYPSVRP